MADKTFPAKASTKAGSQQSAGGQLHPKRKLRDQFHEGQNQAFETAQTSGFESANKWKRPCPGFASLHLGVFALNSYRMDSANASRQQLTRN